ncbi:hypothetical protein COB57_04480 [Candidatus Peregrinibacteria bacterium]|nr:MAG: hypothetical protein COB57_04480 [Candidatus Peregrinibacteria bacterium]
MFFQILYGMLVIIVAVLLIKYRFHIRENFGSIGFFELHFGSTETGIVFVSLSAMVLSFLYMSGHLQIFLQNTVGLLF